MLPSPSRKTGSTVKKEAENPIYVLSAFCGGSGTWIPCPYCHAFIPCSPCPGHCPESRSFSPPFIVPRTTRRLSAWPGGDRATRMVVIVDGLDRVAIDRLWAALAGEPTVDAPDLAALTLSPLSPTRGGLLD